MKEAENGSTGSWSWRKGLLKLETQREPHKNNNINNNNNIDNWQRWVHVEEQIAAAQQMHKIYRIQKRKLYKIYVCNVTLKMKLLKYSCNSFFSIQITAQERLRVRERERERVGQQVKFIFKRSCSCSLNNTSTYRKRPARDESASERATEAETETHPLASVRHFGRQSVCLCVG